MNSPTVKLGELAPARTTRECREYRTCGLVTRIYRAVPQDNRAVGTFQFCPRCGSTNVVVGRSSDTDMWEAYSRDFGLPIHVMQQLYKLWVPSQHRRFSDFVAEVREEALAGMLAAPPTPTPLHPNVPRLVVPGRVPHD
jgi:hypothetical protein